MKSIKELKHEGHQLLEEYKFLRGGRKGIGFTIYYEISKSLRISLEEAHFSSMRTCEEVTRVNELLRKKINNFKAWKGYGVKQ